MKKIPFAAESPDLPHKVFIANLRIPPGKPSEGGHHPIRLAGRHPTRAPLAVREELQMMRVPHSTRPGMAFPSALFLVPMAISVALFLSQAMSASRALGASSVPASIVVHTVTGLPVSVPRNLKAITTVINLDRITAIEAGLAEGLGRIPENRRESAATGRLSPALQQELKETWQALSRIRQGGITHLPAIVFDDRAVWYGSDLRRAVTRYRNRRNAEVGS